jgi:mycothiol synthase
MAMTAQLRPALPAELDAIHALNRRVEIADGIPLVTPREEFDEWKDDPHFSLSHDSRVAVVEGAIVAYGRLWHRPSDSLQSRVFLMGAVDPAWRKQGIGRTLLSWQLARGREILRAAPAHLPRFLRTQAYDFEREAISLYERCGLVAIRYFHELVRPLASIESVVQAPGISLVRWDPSRSEELRVLYNEAFADMWGSSPLDRDGWAHRLAEFGCRTDLSWMALDGDRIVGLALNGHFPGDEELTGRRDGWIRNLGVARAHRKRGIASALVMASCEAFGAAGFTHAALAVDSESPTGAHRIYHRLGFRSLHRMIQHQQELQD